MELRHLRESTLCTGFQLLAVALEFPFCFFFLSFSPFISRVSTSRAFAILRMHLHFFSRRRARGSGFRD